VLDVFVPERPVDGFDVGSGGDSERGRRATQVVHPASGEFGVDLGEGGDGGTPCAGAEAAHRSGPPRGAVKGDAERPEEAWLAQPQQDPAPSEGVCGVSVVVGFRIR
jgi:hypothetical protein